LARTGLPAKVWQQGNRELTGELTIFSTIVGSRLCSEQRGLEKAVWLLTGFAIGFFFWTGLPTT